MDLAELSVTEIKERIKQEENINHELLIALAKDDRIGVKKIYQQILTFKEREIIEEKRLKELLKYEEILWSKGYYMVAGVDEAGRGPLAGPVVAGAVILPRDIKIKGINDSKKLSEKKRDELALVIKEKALAWSVGIVDAEEIDSVNILQASLIAMKKAVIGLQIKPEFVLIDALTIPTLSMPQRGIIGGDALSVSIAAASIIAKTTRDNIMLEYNQQFPQYGFEKHKGYGTAEHIQALKTYGVCPIHRKSFNIVSEYI